MGTKLVKLHLEESLHRRVKTVATSKDRKIEDYISDVLDEHVPTQIFLPANKKSPKPERLTQK